jgi:hypothetical protein
MDTWLVNRLDSLLKKVRARVVPLVADLLDL